jgi:hypothetical protein
LLFIYAFNEITPIGGTPLIDLRAEAPGPFLTNHDDGGSGGKSSPSAVAKSLMYMIRRGWRLSSDHL